MDETFWLYEPSILIKQSDNYIPNENMNEIELLNSITLLCFIILIILIAFKFFKLSFIPLMIIILLVFIYKSKYPVENNIEHFEDMHNIYQQQSYNDTQLDNNYPVNLKNDKMKEIYKNIQEENNIIYRNKNYNKIYNENKLTDINNEYDDNGEIVYYDSNNKLRFDRTYIDRTTNKEHKDNYPNSYNLMYECKKPTKNNPFMNIDLHDYDDNQNVQACNADDDEINYDMIHSYNSRLFMDLDDTYSKFNSQRQFYTTPNTRIPNNQIEFAEWLYKAPETCKENNEHCLRYNDIRYHNLRY